MAPLSANYNPASVMLGQGKGTYLPAKETPNQSNAPTSTTLGPQSIRATGSGPFDAAYRQNLATYAGSQFQIPQGGLNFNPTQPSSFPGQPTGAGGAPLPGMPNTLVGNAISGNPFSWNPPAPSAQYSANPAQLITDPSKFWLNQFLGQGGPSGNVT